MKRISTLLVLIALLLFVGTGALAEEKALIFYYDYSENIDPTGLDVDAISQASMAGTKARDISNLLVMVDVLMERTGADVYSLRVADLYAPNFMDMMDPAREQKENNEMLVFQEELPDFSQYDVIYFGTPVWWYGAPGHSDCSAAVGSVRKEDCVLRYPSRQRFRRDPGRNPRVSAESDDCGSLYCGVPDEQ